MQLSTLVLGIVASAAGSASAYELPLHPAHMVRAVNLQARDTPACTEAASTLLPKVTDYPEPPKDVQDFLLTADVTVTDACELPEVTGSIGEEFSSWASEYSAWQSDHVSDFRELWHACSDVPEVAAAIPTHTTEACSSFVAQITSNPGVPRETGAVAAAALFAAGAVAAAM